MCDVEKIKSIGSDDQCSELAKKLGSKQYNSLTICPYCYSIISNPILGNANSFYTDIGSFLDTLVRILLKASLVTISPLSGLTLGVEIGKGQCKPLAF